MKSSTPRPDENRAERAVGKHVVGPADIVADGLRRMAAEEDRARHCGSCAGERVRVLGLDLEVLGREPVDQRHRSRRALDQDDRAEIAPARPGDLGLAASVAKLPLDAASTASARRRCR